jgi:hypothetical protein
MQYLLQFLKNLWTFGSKYLIWFLLFITPIHPFLITIYILLFFDLITGISKAIKIKEPITSKRMRDSVLKFLFYSVAVYIGYQVDITLISKSALVLSKLVGGYIMLIEFQSNIENISVITGVDLWVMMKDKVMNYFNDKITEDKRKSND